jgi:hypothetical protein
MKMYYVHALEADGCEIAADFHITKREANARFMEFRTDPKLKAAGAVRVKMFDERTGECVKDETMATHSKNSTEDAS